MFQLSRALHQAATGLDERALGGERNQEVEMLERALQGGAADELRQELRGTRPGLRHVRMWVVAIGNERRGLFQHRLRYVRVQIETCDHRYVGADAFAHARQQFAVGVVQVLGDHRAVQIEVDRLHWQRSGQVLEQDECDALECVPSHRA